MRCNSGGRRRWRRKSADDWKGCSHSPSVDRLVTVRHRRAAPTTGLRSLAMDADVQGTLSATAGRTSAIAMDHRTPEKENPNTRKQDEKKKLPPTTPHAQKPANKDSNNAVFIQGSIGGRSRLCLVDTGSEVSLVPHADVEGTQLHSSRRVLLAANGTEINVLGELSIPLKMWGVLLSHLNFW